MPDPRSKSPPCLAEKPSSVTPSVFYSIVHKFTFPYFLVLRDFVKCQTGLFQKLYLNWGTFWLTKREPELNITLVWAIYSWQNSLPLITPILSSGFVSTVCLITCSGRFPGLKIRLFMCNSPLFKDKYYACWFLPHGNFDSLGWPGQPIVIASSTCADSAFSIPPKLSPAGFFLLHSLVFD